MAGIYHTDGTIRVTIVDGSTRVKILADDGSLNIIQSNGTPGPLYHACGAIRVTNSDGTRVHNPDGSWYRNMVFGRGITIVAGAFV